MDVDEVTVVLDARKQPRGTLRRIVAAVRRHPGGARVFLEIQTSEGVKQMMLRDEVDPTRAFFDEIRALRPGIVAVPGRLP